MRSKYEIKAQKELEAEGYLVDNKAGMGRFAKNRDFFNLFDLVAIKKNEPIRYISIKGRGHAWGENKTKIEKFWLPEFCRKEQWRWHKNKKEWIKKIL